MKITIDLPEGVPSIWRELQIRGDASLKELGDAIEASFHWTGQHKHEFVAADGSWKATRADYGPPEFDDTYASEEEMFLKDAAPREGQAFTYGYDMTDPWSHFVEVVSITSEGDLTTKLTDGKRAGVPEDCGGASGFEEFLEALSPEDPEHKAMAAWYKTECPNGGGQYDPENIDFDQINKKLAAWSPS